MAQSSANFNSVSYYNDLFARTGLAFKSRETTKSVGLQRLAQSFDSNSLFRQRIEDNLPIFQTPALRPPLSLGIGDALQFERLMASAVQFKELGGQLFETLLWEPLFTGWASRAADFDSLFASFYGARLWYQELVLVPKLRGMNPVGEILAAQGRLADSNFHVYRSFVARGFCDARVNCQVFSSLSSRRRVALLPARYVAGLARHFAKELFTRSNLFARLSDVGVWGDYHERFLKPACGISLLPQIIADLLKPNSIDDYIFGVYELLENGLFGADSGRLMAVKCRRSIQQRSLQAIQLRELVSQGEFFFSHRFEKSYALCVLDIYLEMLAVALETLVKHNDCKRARREYSAADEFYSDNLRRYFAQSRVIGRLGAPQKPLEFALGKLNFAEDPRQSLEIINGVLGAITGKTRALDKLEPMRDFATIDLQRIKPWRGEFYDLSHAEPSRRG